MRATPPTAEPPPNLRNVGQSALDMGAKTVKLELQADPLKPMRFTAENPDYGTLVIILMPYRL